MRLIFALALAIPLLPAMPAHAEDGFNAQMQQIEAAFQQREFEEWQQELEARIDQIERDRINAEAWQQMNDAMNATSESLCWQSNRYKSSGESC